GRLDAGKRELREMVIRAQAAPPTAQLTTLAGLAPPPPTAAAVLVSGLPALPPRAPVPPPEGPSPLKTGSSSANETGTPLLPSVLPPSMYNVPRLPEVTELAPLESDPVPDSGNVSMSLQGRTSLVNRLQLATPWRRRPVLVAWVGLTVGLAALLAIVAFTGKHAPSESAATNAVKPSSPEPASKPPESDPSAPPAAVQEPR